MLTAESGNGEDSPVQQSVLVPLAIRWPGKLKPRVAGELLISHADVLPTLLAFLELRRRKDCRVAISNLIANGAGEVPDSVYCEGRIGLPAEWRAVIRGYDKLVIRPQEEATRLYNLADDPGEENDLAHDREHELTRDSMSPWRGSGCASWAMEWILRDCICGISAVMTTSLRYARLKSERKMTCAKRGGQGLARVPEHPDQARGAWLIDRAAALTGKNRTDSVLDASQNAAQDALLIGPFSFSTPKLRRVSGAPRCPAAAE